MKINRKNIILSNINIVLVLSVLLFFVYNSSYVFAWTSDPFGGDAEFASSGTWQFPDIHPSHPRILITSDDIPNLLWRVDNDPAVNELYYKLKSWADGETTSSVTSNSNPGQRADILKNLVLLTLIEKEKGNSDPHYLSLTKTSINNLPELSYKVYDVQAMAMAYDWLFDEWSESEKQDIVNDMISRCFRSSKQGYFYTFPHPGAPKNQIGGLVAGLAFYNDGIEDQKAIDIIEYYGEWTDDGWMPMIRMVGGTTGGTNKPRNYFYDGAKGQIEHIEAWRTATGRNLHIGNSYDRYYPYWDIYALRPDNQAILTNLGKTPKSGIQVGWVNYPLVASTYKEPLAQTFASLGPDLQYDWWRHILWYDSSLPSQPYSELPLTRFFNGSEDVMMRTGWTIGSGYENPSDDVYARFKCGNFYRGQHNYDQNNFEIYYKGSLLTEGDPTTYATRDHNTILIDDDDQLHPDRSISSSSTPEEVLDYWGEDTPSDVADITRFETTNDYDYILGDATNAYDPNKLSHFTREFVFLRDYYFVIFDRVTTTQASHSKTFLLHSVGEVSKDNNVIKIDRGGTPSNRPNLNGRLFSKTLLPENPSISISGGSSPSWDNAEDSTATIRINPSSSSTNDFFLHVMHVTDSSTSSMTNTVRISNSDGNMTSNNMIGAHIKDSTRNQVALFSSDPEGDIPSGNIVYTISPTTDSKHYLFGLYTSTAYSVDVVTSGSTQTITVSLGSGYTSSSQGSLVFSVSSDGVVIENDIIPPSPPINLILTQ